MLATTTKPEDILLEIEHTLNTVESVRETVRLAHFHSASAKLSEVIDSIIDLKINLEEAGNERHRN